MVVTLSCGAAAQTKVPTPNEPKPSVTFVLSAGPLAQRKGNPFVMSAIAPKPMIAATADGSAILALIPQQEESWELQRLTHWDSGSPNVERLSFAGDPQQDRQDFLQTGIALSPDGKFAVVQIFTYNMHRYDRRVLIAIVDLTTFRVVDRRFSNDQALANSRLRFRGNTTLVAAQGPVPTRDNGHPLAKEYISLNQEWMNPFSEGGHEVAVLSFPTLERRQSCHYDIAPLGLPAGATAGSAEDPNTWWSTRRSGVISIKSAEPNCDAVFAAAGVSNAVELPEPMVAALEMHGGHSCRLDAVAPQASVAAYNCRSGHYHKNYSFFTSWEGERVASGTSGAPSLELQLKAWAFYVAALARAGGRNYLLMLRDKLTVEVYALP